MIGVPVSKRGIERLGRGLQLTLSNFELSGLEEDIRVEADGLAYRFHEVEAARGGSRLRRDGSGRGAKKDRHQAWQASS